MSKNPNAAPPYLQGAHSLGEASDVSRTQIESSSQNFTDQYHDAMRANDALDDIRVRTEQIVREGREYLDDAMQLLQQLGVDTQAAQDKVRDIRKDREESLMTEDYEQLARYSSDIAELLIQKGALTRGARTESDRKKFFDAAKVKFEKFDSGKYVEKVLGWDVICDLLQKPYDQAECQTLKDTVLAAATADRKMSGDRKTTFKHEVRDVFDFIKALSGHIGDAIPLSERSVYGMLGRVLPEAQRKEVFAGKLDALKSVSSGSVELVFADAHEHFYHEQGQDDLPQTVRDRLSAAMPSRILMVHYRTDDDVRELFKDLSDGQYISGPKRGKESITVTVEGISGSDDVKFGGRKPNKIELLATPMKVFAHGLHFHRLGQPKPKNSKP